MNQIRVRNLNTNQVFENVDMMEKESYLNVHLITLNDCFKSLPIKPKKLDPTMCTIVDKTINPIVADNILCPSNYNDRLYFLGIQGYGIVQDSTQHTVYILKIQQKCKRNWIIYRRFQDFLVLHQTLNEIPGYKSYVNQVERVPWFPSKLPYLQWLYTICSVKWWMSKKKMHAVVTEHRQVQFTKWLSFVLTIPFGALKEYLPDEYQHMECITQIGCIREFLSKNADPSPYPLESSPVGEHALSVVNAEFPKHPVRNVQVGNQPVTLHSFSMIKVVGKGSFGKVVLVRHKLSKQLYAMKVLSKPNIIERKQVQHTLTERRVLGYTNHPFIVNLHYAFQSKLKLFFILDYCPGGELFYHLSRYKRFTESMVIFYSAQIILALEHLHGLGVIYRDLKPENLLLDASGNLKLADFGLAKENVVDSTSGANSLCGTPEYLPPEILNCTGHGYGVDWWTLGMVIYELLTGLPPWYTDDRVKLFQRIRSAKLCFPSYVSARSRKLIKSLLMRDPNQRLCSKFGASEIKNHEFYQNVDWCLLYQKKNPPPIPIQARESTQHLSTMTLAQVTGKNFESEFTNLPLPTIEQQPISIVLATTKERTNHDSIKKDAFINFTYEKSKTHDSTLDPTLGTSIAA